MNNCETADDVKRMVKDLDISFIQLWFTDVLGVLKSFAITPSELEEGLDEGMGFDGSSIEGFARIQESDMVAKPEPGSFELVPWRGGERPVATLFVSLGEAYLRAGRCADAATMLAYAGSIGAPAETYMPTLQEAQLCPTPTPRATEVPSS